MNPVHTSPLPPDIMVQVLETLHTDLGEQAGKKYSVYHPNDQKALVGRDVAKDFAKLKLLNSEFRQFTNAVLNQHEHTELAVTRESILHLAKQADLTQVRQRGGVLGLRFLGHADLPMFRQHIARLIQQHKHISVPFKHLDVLQSKIVFEELGNAPTNHLNKVVLKLVDLPRQVWDKENDLANKLNSTLTRISQQQENCQIALHLHDTNMNAKDLVKLLNHLSNTKVHHLELGGCNLDRLGRGAPIGEALAAAIQSPNLTHLCLAYCQPNAAQLQAIGRALSSSRLLTLNMSLSPIQPEAMQVIIQHLPSSQLKHLNFWDCSIEDRDAVLLAEVLPNTQLEFLELRSNRIEDAGGLAIARALPHSKLKRLDLRLNDISDIGGTAIAEALPESQLSHLDLHMNKLKDDGIMAFARAIPHCPTLEQLLLGGNEPTYSRCINLIRRAVAYSAHSLELDI
jgi:hypothetical protein